MEIRIHTGGRAMKVRIHTAGAAQGSPGPGGYGAVLMPFQNPVVVCGNNVSTNEEEMGLRAIVEGITQAWTIFGNEIRGKVHQYPQQFPKRHGCRASHGPEPRWEQGKNLAGTRPSHGGTECNFIHDDEDEENKQPRG